MARILLKLRTYPSSFGDELFFKRCPVLPVVDRKVQFLLNILDVASRIILGMGSANERRRYIVTTSLIG